MNKDNTISRLMLERLHGLSYDVEQQKKRYRDYYWYLINSSMTIQLPDGFILGVEVNGTYTAGDLRVDFWEKNQGVFKKCWQFSHIDTCPEDLVNVIVDNISKFLKDQMKKERNRQRRKYEKGEAISSIDDLMKQEFVYFDDKIYHCGWFRSWQLSMVVRHMDNSRIFYAIRKEDDHV